MRRLTRTLTQTLIKPWLSNSHPIGRACLVASVSVTRAGTMGSYPSRAEAMEAIEAAYSKAATLAAADA